MLELEVYAAGLDDLDKILELDHQLAAIPGLRYKVDRNHNLVYLELVSQLDELLRKKPAWHLVVL